MAFKGITAFVLGNNGEGGGGGGGTTNYNDLTNHPQINGNELTGNKTADQLGLLPSDTDIPTKLSDLDEDATHRTVTDLEKQSWNNKVDSVAGKGLSTNDYTDEDKTALTNKVDKVTGKGLSTNDYTDGEKEDVAQVDGLVSSVGGLTSRVGIAEGKVRTLEGEMLSVQDALDTKVDKETGKGLSTNDYSNADKAIVDGVTTALAGKVDTSSIGTANGVAGLDNTGRVPSSQLPSYVDDVLEYASLSAFPATGEGGKIYIALDTNKTYRWSGSAYVEISESLALGETQGTAYEGNKGKANADAIAVLETTVGAIPEQIETVVKDTVGFVGKNKLKITYSGDTYTHNGITFTLNRNSNGEVTSIVANGTNDGTRNSEFIFARPQFPNGTYIFSGGISENKRMYYYSGSQWYDTKGEPVEFTVNDDSNTAVAIVIVKNSICNNDTFYPMIYDANIIDAEFEPYHETVQEMFDSLGTASTKNAISVVTDSSDLVESGAVKNLVGWGNANLLDKSELTNKDGNTVTQITDGVIITLTKNDAYISTACRIYGDFADKEIYLKFAYSSTGNVKPCISVRPYNANGNEIVNNRLDGVDIPSPVNIHRTMPTGTAYLMIVVYGTYNVTGSIGDTVTYTDIMVSTADITYEPYHASVEETIPQVVSDAVGWDVGNLFNSNVALTEYVYIKDDGTTGASGDWYLTDYIEVVGGLKLIISDYAPSAVVNPSICWYTDNKTYIAGQKYNAQFPVVVDLPTNAKYIRLSIHKDKLNAITVLYPTVNETKADNSVIAPTENSPTASQAYAVGDYFIKDTILGKTKAAIASGGTFTKDTNYEETNVAKELTELYKYIGILTTPVEAFTANSLPILKRNITNAFYNGSLRGEIAAGNFKNVRPGDYIIGQATGSTYYVAECDYWLGNGDSTNGTTYPAYNTHHLGLMLFKPVGTTALWRGYGYSDKSWRVSAADLGRCPWNADTTVDPTDTEAIGSNSTNITRSYNGTNMSAYMGSFIRERIDAILLPQCFQADFGSENVLKRRNWLSNAINASAASGARSDWQGIASGSVWVDRFIDLPSEVELYGSRINSSSRDDVGVQNKQLPIFRNGRIHDFYPRVDIWTKAVASSSYACIRYGGGYALAYNASCAYWACPLGCVK